jgi:exosortase
LLAALLPWLAPFFAQLWLRPHYQFFPLVLLGAGVLAYVGLRTPAAPSPALPVLGGALIALAWALLALAAALASPWVAAVAAMVLLAGGPLALGGGGLFRRLLPAWVLLWVVVPPPLELDRNLILWLQALTASWASSVLDLLGVYHVMAGNVVEVTGRRLLVEEACSGVNSLFSVLACTLFLVLLTRRPPVRSVLLLAAAVAWVLAANVTRVVGVVVLDTRWGIDLTAGWRHEAFGLVLFVVAVGLIASTDQLLLFLTHPGSAPGAAAGPAAMGVPAAGPAVPAGAWLAAAAFLGLGAAYAGLHVLGDGPAGGAAAPAFLDDLAAETLPAQVGPWRRRDFSTQTRNPGSAFGETSRTWSYQDGASTAAFSVDYPFPGWHDLTRCYTGQGWVREEQEVREAVKEANAEAPGLVEVTLSKPAYRSGYLLFTQCDRHGEVLAPRKGGAYLALYRHESAYQRWRALFGDAGDLHADPPPPVYQVQLFVETYGPATAAQRRQALALFRKGWQALRQRWEAGR